MDALRVHLPATQWIVVGLWCPRGEAAERVAARGNHDQDARLTVWDQTPTLFAPPASTLNTAEHHPVAVANLIADAIRTRT